MMVTTMRGWPVPPPRAPEKSAQEFGAERAAKVQWLVQRGYLRTERLREALLVVRREDFIPDEYRDYAYREVPLPLPGEHATISCPHSYPLFYEPLGLDLGHRFLEVGTGSGYGAAVAREVVGEGGLVVSVEIDPRTHRFAKGNLERAGYEDVVLVRGDGGLGHPELAPYDTVAITAACAAVPSPLLGQLRMGGRLLAPFVAGDAQDLVLLEKMPEGVGERVLCQVLYIPLRGAHG